MNSRPCLCAPSIWGHDARRDPAGMAPRFRPQLQRGGPRPSRITELSVHGRTGEAQQSCSIETLNYAGVERGFRTSRSAQHGPLFVLCKEKSWSGHVGRLRPQVAVPRIDLPGIAERLDKHTVEITARRLLKIVVYDKGLPDRRKS